MTALHDAQGTFIESVDLDVPGETAIQHNGKLYVWHQRTGQYREIEVMSTSVPVGEFTQYRPTERAKTMMAEATTVEPPASTEDFR